MTAQNIEKIILQAVPKHGNNLIPYLVKKTGTTRQNIYRYLRRLIKEEKILKTGHTKGTQYFLPSSQKSHFQYKLAALDENEVWRMDIAPLLQKAPQNVYKICHYGFTEMCNNAIDHSEGKNLIVTAYIAKDSRIHVSLQDDGIGIFKNIRKALNISSNREAMLHLTKGKFTTDPKRHTGEGIFFTSRIFDFFTITSSQFIFGRIGEKDWFIESASQKSSFRGTQVKMIIDLHSSKNLRDIFQKYMNSEDYSFEKTEIIVELSTLDQEELISRSQAKRITFGLEKFRKIILDFKGVSTIGQGFVDEIFRVFQNANPNIEITHRNANEDVEFMIRRGLA